MRNAPHALLALLVHLLVTALLGPLGGCRAFRAYSEPLPLTEVPFRERALTETDGGLTVTVAVPSREETKAIFGTSLYSARIQPVWIEVINREERAYLLMRVGLDPNYFSPLEAAYVRHTTSDARNKRMDSHFEELAFPGSILPGTTASGFVFSGLDEGHKAVYIDLVGDQDQRSFSFTVPVPGLVTDVDRVDLDSLYPEFRQIDDEAELREALRALPATTSNEAGTQQGDPLNIVLIGDSNDAFAALVRRGWHQTEVTYASSAWKTLKSFLFGSQYLYSPISPLYVFDRAQDIGMQKARSSVHMRNHMRLWRTPLDFREKPVWLGQVSRDVGVRFTTKSKTLTTHAIDPDVDDTRDGLVGDLAYSQGMARVGFVGGAPVSERSAPRRNLTGDVYYTDGRRAVMFFERRPTSLVEIEILDWELPDSVSALEGRVRSAEPQVEPVKDGD